MRDWWQNCAQYHDGSLAGDETVAAVDAMADSLAPLDEPAAATRTRIALFESCYHEADKEAQLIVDAIASGRAPVESAERPPQRRRQLQNCRDVLSAWYDNALETVAGIDVGGLSPWDIAAFIGPRTPLKEWQVRRLLDRVGQALDPACRYHNMALDTGDGRPPGAHYDKDAQFLRQTVATVIHDTVDGQEGQTSLALAIDLFMPCHWDFVGALTIILGAVGGDLHPDRPLAYCARNIRLSPLGGRLRTISATLMAFWNNEDPSEEIDRTILSSLGARTPVRRWLAASLGRTIRLQLDAKWTWPPGASA